MERVTPWWQGFFHTSHNPVAGADPEEVKWVNSQPPISEPPSFFLFSYPSSNIEIISDFSDIITKIHPPPPPPFQNPGYALE